MSTLTVTRAARTHRRLAVAGAALALALPICACKEIETTSSVGYEPSKVEAIGGDDTRKRVRFTDEGARRAGIKLAPVLASDGHPVVPYAALIYDAEGKTYVYTSPSPLTYVREEVTVSRITGQRVHLTSGPRAGSSVVTIGAAEVYGAELDIAGSH